MRVSRIDSSDSVVRGNEPVKVEWSARGQRSELGYCIQSVIA